MPMTKTGKVPSLLRASFIYDVPMLKHDARQANWHRANPAKYDAHLAVGRRQRWICLESKCVNSVGPKRSILITIDTTSP
ncbi:hypothetical protein AGR1B_pa0204 [Agrobacterium fabacearum S56]|nr:hypothetical protein AGR1B_pa0204 [Agrobacterium fabacearum S56]